MIYLDTSLLVKLYVPEADSRELEDRIGKEQHIALSDLTRVEFASAVGRLVREGTMTKARGKELNRRLARDWSMYTRVVVEDAVLDRAQELLAAHPLRSLDAIQLASALVIATRLPESIRFGTADRQLAQAAADESLAPL